MLSALSGAGADYLVVGAYALAAHGYVRATGDLDLWIRPTPENAARVYEALRRFGAPLRDVSVQDLHTPDLVVQIGLPPRRIDLLTSIDGVAFDAAWQRRDERTVSGLLVPLLHRDDLVQNKRASGRPQDLADLDGLGEMPS